MLYYRGVLPDFSEKLAISIVGTRRLSEYGRKNAFNISFDLAAAGAVIVSGMAIGIDGVAMAAALSASGQTVAFLGSGIDVCYPAAHRRLAQQIVKNGCVFTEFHPGASPDRMNFPIRNRLVSGLSAATLVIEGREKSGALITARYAKEQNKALYALPGNVGSPHSELTNMLIRNGAASVTSADDIINDFEATSPGKLNPFVLRGLVRSNMNDVLRELEVSALTANDDAFKPTDSYDS